MLISLFILSSCENPTGVGLDVDPEDQIDALFTDTVSLRAYTVRDDSVQSASFNQALFGWFRDPIFGRTNVGLALDIGRPAELKQLYPEAEIDSIVLVLPYAGDYYGDTLASTFHVRVRPLDEPFQVNTYSTYQWDVKDEVIGSKVLGRYAYKLGQGSDSVRVTQHIDGRDTTVWVRPQLRIRLSEGFFREKLGISVDSATLATAASFRNHLKGLYLDIDTSTSDGIGGLVSFVGVNGISGIELNYRQPNGLSGEDADVDTIRTLLPIYPFSSSTGTYSGLASSVETVYSTPIVDQLTQTEEVFESIYLHAPTGLRGRVELPYIDQLKGKGLLINKAELVLYVDEERMDGPFTRPAPRLTLYREDIAGNRQNIPDGSGMSAGGIPMDSRSLSYLGFGGWYNQETKRYIFHLTSYIQDVLQGKINGSELFVAPVSVFDQYVPLQPALNAGGRVILGGGANPNYKMKLNLYYTHTNR